MERDQVIATLLEIGWNRINESGFLWRLELTGGIIYDQISKAIATVLTKSTIVTSADLAREEEK